jgi:hypothetical protein
LKQLFRNATGKVLLSVLLLLWQQTSNLVCECVRLCLLSLLVDWLPALQGQGAFDNHL